MAACASAVLGDGNVVTTAVYHDNTDPNYRVPVGGIQPNGSAIVRLRTCHSDVQQVQVLVWKTGDPLNAPSFTYNVTSTTQSGVYDIWEYSVPGPGSNIDQWYQFRVIDGSTTGYYHPASGNTGPGVWAASLLNPSWSLPTIPAPPQDYQVPGWIKDAVIYQIFPDRFRNGDPANDISGTTIYGPTTCSGYSGGAGRRKNFF